MERAEIGDSLFGTWRFETCDQFEASWFKRQLGATLGVKNARVAIAARKNDSSGCVWKHTVGKAIGGNRKALGCQPVFWGLCQGGNCSVTSHLLVCGVRVFGSQLSGTQPLSFVWQLAMMLSWSLLGPRKLSGWLLLLSLHLPNPYSAIGFIGRWLVRLPTVMKAVFSSLFFRTWKLSHGEETWLSQRLQGTRWPKGDFNPHLFCFGSRLFYIWIPTVPPFPELIRAAQ